MILKKLREGGQGFTLIELLVVIAVLGVLAAGVIVAINPLKRIQQANDTKIRNDVGQIATGMQAYFTTNQFYPATVALLVTSKDLKTEPKVPPAGTASYTVVRTTGTACTTAPYTGCEVAVSAVLQDWSGLRIDGTAGVSGDVWCWRSFTGTAGQTTVALCTAP